MLFNLFITMFLPLVLTIVSINKKIITQQINVKNLQLKLSKR